VHASRTTQHSDLPAALSTNIARFPLLPAELKLIRHHPSPFFDLLFIQRVELIGAALAYGLANLAVHSQYGQASGEEQSSPAATLWIAARRTLNSVNIIIQRSLNGSNVKYGRAIPPDPVIEMRVSASQSGYE